MNNLIKGAPYKLDLEANNTRLIINNDILANSISDTHRTNPGGVTIKLITVKFTHISAQSAIGGFGGEQTSYAAYRITLLRTSKLNLVPSDVYSDALLNNMFFRLLSDVPASEQRIYHTLLDTSVVTTKVFGVSPFVLSTGTGIRRKILNTDFVVTFSTDTGNKTLTNGVSLLITTVPTQFFGLVISVNCFYSLN